ncbi:MAG: PA2779 family protein [Burkholderiales bacterium]
MTAKLRRIIASLLVVSITGLGLPLPVHAGMVGTDAVLASAERQRIAGFLDRADVRQQLQAQGVSPAEVKARVAAMTDEEAAQLAVHMDSVPAGGSVLGVILIVFLVLLLTDIMGFTKIFPFTRPVR